MPIVLTPRQNVKQPTRYASSAYLTTIAQNQIAIANQTNVFAYMNHVERSAATTAKSAMTPPAAPPKPAMIYQKNAAAPTLTPAAARLITAGTAEQTKHAQVVHVAAPT